MLMVKQVQVRSLPHYLRMFHHYSSTREAWSSLVSVSDGSIAEPSSHERKGQA